jgi:hypothetical protein
MSGASALYVPPDPNTAPGTDELGNEKSAFKIFGEKKIFAGAGCRPAAHWIVMIPSTARHSVGQINRSWAILTEWSAALISSRQ